MKYLVLVIALSLLLLLLFYGAYYIINPSQSGEEIVSRYQIPYPAISAHRGASIVAPESTAPAYIRARESGADYLEADLQLTKDGRVVIFHDRTLEDKSNVEQVFPHREDYRVGNFTYKELQQLDFGSWFNQKKSGYADPEFEGLNIITLEKLIKIAEAGRNNPGLMLEFKHPYDHEHLEKKTVDILSEKDWLEIEDVTDVRGEETPVNVGQGAGRLIFMSFDIESLNSIKKLAPQFPRILLITDNMITRRSWSRWLETAKELVHGLGAKGFMTWPWHIAAAHEKGLFVFPYTINELWQIKILSRFRADGFITDRPEIVVDFLERPLPLFPHENDEID